ncbi:deoxyribodipyrimidine photo-lyase [uncultured Ilyobacter sp.]|uniref:deoxyribodipyrimidine photo-lyase n=1 Tax=uncultured Ilyobacter sp. TaxID=544433 RepID=UPI0029C6A44C|nr:deoxyribodipyrimidine photo-lyase [uncultured Ilyobacter sp.]
MERRFKLLNEKDIREKGEYVLYWMQGSQRTRYNHCLEYGILKANEMKKPLIVVFNLVDGYPDANERHYAFMVQGLKDVKQALADRKIEFYMLHGDMIENIVRASEEASLLVCDKGYMNIQKKWRFEISSKVNCQAVEIDTNLVVPVEAASEKEEYAARTIREKIKRQLDEFLYDFEEVKYSVNKGYKGKFCFYEDNLNKSLNNIDKGLENMKLNKSVSKSSFFYGGEKKARERLDEFIENRLDGYGEKNSDPGEDNVSKLSPYLHFGNISPVEIALELLKVKNELNRESIEDFLEELIIRRELSHNFIYYNDRYDKWEGITYGWAYETMEKHLKDKRENLYSMKKLENGETHDIYWNAAQKEMVVTGFMHGYMRMYWCKKILEWSKTPKEAYERTIYFNNKYFIDGRDPNSYTGAAWCFGKHDRAWKEREIFGKIRYMNFEGLRRKFDMDKYLKRIEEL